jgi:hypothetical protein
VIRISNIAISGIDLLASTSMAMSHSRGWINGSWYGAQGDTGAYAQMYPQYGETGPYLRSGPGVAPSGWTQRHPTAIPFTWEEKHAFDYQNPRN